MPADIDGLPKVTPDDIAAIEEEINSLQDMTKAKNDTEGAT